MRKTITVSLDDETSALYEQLQRQDGFNFSFHARELIRSLGSTDEPTPSFLKPSKTD
jgi:hypothetical protein